MTPPLEITNRPHQDVCGYPSPSQRLVGEAASTALSFGVIGHHDQDVKITVRSRISTCVRAEKVDPLRVIGEFESFDDLVEL